MTMNLFLLERDGGGYDEAHGFVIAAHDETQARNIAGRHAGDESAQVWHEDSTTVSVVGTAAGYVEAGVILRDFNADW